MRGAIKDFGNDDIKTDECTTVKFNFIQALPMSVTKLNKKEWNEINIQHLTPGDANKRKSRTNFKAPKECFNKTLIHLKNEYLDDKLRAKKLLKKWNKIRSTLNDEFERVKQAYKQDLDIKGRSNIKPTDADYYIHGLSVFVSIHALYMFFLFFLFFRFSNMYTIYTKYIYIRDQNILRYHQKFGKHGNGLDYKKEIRIGTHVLNFVIAIIIQHKIKRL